MSVSCRIGSGEAWGAATETVGGGPPTAVNSMV